MSDHMKPKVKRKGLPVRFMREARIAEGEPRLLPGHDKLIGALAVAAVDAVMGPEVPEPPKKKRTRRQESR